MTSTSQSKFSHIQTHPIIWEPLTDKTILLHRQRYVCTIMFAGSLTLGDEKDNRVSILTYEHTAKGWYYDYGVPLPSTLKVVAIAEVPPAYVTRNSVQNYSKTNKLSIREKQVFDLIGAGSKPKDACAAMGISAKTYSTYRSRIMEKTVMRNNADIVIFRANNPTGVYPND